MLRRRLGRDGPLVSALGLGCMGMSDCYDAAAARSEAAALEALDAALDLGMDFLDTAEVYGPWTNERLLGRALRGRRDRVVLASKFGFALDPAGRITGVDGRPQTVRASCEASLARLGTDVLDLYYYHRLDPAVAIEETVGAMADLVREGKVRHLGLSEVGAGMLRRACAVHPIAALQSEYSLWERNVEPDVLPACRELGVGFVAFAPLGRGFLTGRAPRAEEAAAHDDIRGAMPRFQGDNYDRNRQLVGALERLAPKLGATPAQLALAWLLAQGEDVVPIPGSKSTTHLRENAAAVGIRLSSCDRMALEEAFPRGAAAGARYDEAMQRLVNR